MKSNTKITLSKESKKFDKLLKKEKQKIPHSFDWCEEIEVQIDVRFKDDIGDFLVFYVYEYNESVPNEYLIPKSYLLDWLENGFNLEIEIEDYIRKHR